MNALISKAIAATGALIALAIIGAVIFFNNALINLASGIGLLSGRVTTQTACFKFNPARRQLVSRVCVSAVGPLNVLRLMALGARP